MTPLADVKFVVQIFVFRASWGEDVWSSLNTPTSYREAATNKRWLERSMPEMNFRILARP